MGNPKSAIERVANVQPRTNSNQLKRKIAIAILTVMNIGLLVVFAGLRYHKFMFTSSTNNPVTRPSLPTNPITHEPVTRPSLPMNLAYGGKSANPGAVLRLTKSLMVSYVEEGFREVEKKEPSDHLLGDVLLPMTNGQLIISRLRLTSLTLPITFHDAQPPSDLCWRIKKGHLAASGIWTYENFLNDIVNSTGVVNIPPAHHSSTVFSAQLNTTMGRNSDHQPVITKVVCRVHLDNPKMYFSSPKAQARSAIIGIESNLTEMIEDVLESSMCDLISIVLQMSLNKFLSTFRTKIELWNDPKITLDYSLLADPFVDPVYSTVNALLKGSIYVNCQNALTIFPHEMQLATNNTEKSVTVTFNDYLLNSLLQSAYEANALHLITVNNTYSNLMSNYLKLNCDSDVLCVGSAFPFYPDDAYAEISLQINPSPSAVFLESGAFLKLTGYIRLYIQMTDPSTKFSLYFSPFSLIAALTPDVRSDNSNTVIFMEAKLVELFLFPAWLRDRDLVMTLMTLILEEIMNKPLRKGIPLPMFVSKKIVHLRNHEFTFFNRTLLLSQFVQSF